MRASSAEAGLVRMFSAMAAVVLRAEVLVYALRYEASTVCGPAFSERATARVTPARSTTVAVTLYPPWAQFCTASCAIRTAADVLRFAWVR